MIKHARTDEKTKDEPQASAFPYIFRALVTSLHALSQNKARNGFGFFICFM